MDGSLLALWLKLSITIVKTKINLAIERDMLHPLKWV